MAAGKGKKKHSPIVRAIAQAESRTTGEIHVHLSKRIFERDPYRRAQKLFLKYGIARTQHRNGVLFYVNLRRKKFAIIGDSGIHEKVGQVYWEELSRELSKDLRATHMENAIALAVATIGITLERFFPLEIGEEHHPEHIDDVTED